MGLFLQPRDVLWEKWRDVALYQLSNIRNQLPQKTKCQVVHWKRRFLRCIFLHWMPAMWVLKAVRKTTAMLARHLCFLLHSTNTVYWQFQEVLPHQWQHVRPYLTATSGTLEARSPVRNHLASWWCCQFYEMPGGSRTIISDCRHSCSQNRPASKPQNWLNV